MVSVFGMPVALLASQILLGLINGAFYALMSLGLAVIFGLLNVVNFAHGALFTMGAFVAWLILDRFGLGYWPALIVVPLVVAVFGALIERGLISRLRNLDHVYGLLLTFGLALMIEGLLRIEFGGSGLSYNVPDLLQGTVNLGFMFLPIYRLWVIGAALVLCFLTWLVVEKTRLGAQLRAATENPELVRSFGIRVPRLLTLTYAAGAALAAMAGMLAAPIYSVSPNMGSDLVIMAFAVVVIGGMGSITGSIATGFGLGLIEALTKIVYPQAASVIVFVVMVIVLVIRPAGLFGRADR